MEQRHAKHLARAVFALGRGFGRLLPSGLREHLEDRVFYAVHQLTRVTNDDYVSEEVRRRRRQTPS